MGWDRPADNEDPGGGLAPSPRLPHTWGLQRSPTHREHHLHPLRRGGQCAWASLSEARQGPGSPFCHPQVATAGVRSGGSPATSGLWEKGHRKRGRASDPGAPSQPHPPGRASGDPAGTFRSCPAGHAHARLPLQHQGEAEGIGFRRCKQAPENHQLPGQPHRAEIRVSGPALVWREPSSTPLGCWPNPAPAAAGGPTGAPGPPPARNRPMASRPPPLSLWNFVLSLQVGKTPYSRDARAWQGATLRRPHICTSYTQRKGPQALALPSCTLAVWGGGAVMVNLMRQLDSSGESPDVWVCL